MITFTFDILQLVCEQQIDNQPNAVSGAHIRLTATNGEQTRSNVVFVPLSVDYNNTNFIAFDQLTDNQVRTWIMAETAVMNEYKRSLEIMLAEVAEPTSLNRDPPWVVTASAPSESAYVLLRRTNYPRVTDQLDMLWHSMDTGEIAKSTAFYDAIKAVKDQYPKS
jgi:hypothetical protein